MTLGHEVEKREAGISEGDWLLIAPGQIDYLEALSLQMTLVAACRNNLISGAMVVLEHVPVITLGRSTPTEEVENLTKRLGQTEVRVISVSRGGKATYHGPGQLVAYPIVRLNSSQVVDYVRKLEHVIVDTLLVFGIQGTRRAGHTGVWVRERKIASIGIAVSCGIAYHGLALNVCTDMSYFHLIKPCGLTAADMTSMQEIVGRVVSVEGVRPVFLETFRSIMGVSLELVSNAELTDRLAVGAFSAAQA